jgi:hypothetical protein
MALPHGVDIGVGKCEECGIAGPVAFIGEQTHEVSCIELCADCLTTKVLPPLNAYVTPTEPDFEIKS